MMLSLLLLPEESTFVILNRLIFNWTGTSLLVTTGSSFLIAGKSSRTEPYLQIRLQANEWCHITQMRWDMRARVDKTLRIDKDERPLAETFEYLKMSHRKRDVSRISVPGAISNLAVITFLLCGTIDTGSIGMFHFARGIEFLLLLCLFFFFKAFFLRFFYSIFIFLKISFSLRKTVDFLK